MPTAVTPPHPLILSNQVARFFPNPQKFPENALNRRNVVLGQMVKNGYLREDELEILKEKPIDVSNFNRTFHFDGIAPHFKATLTSELKNLFSFFIAYITH